MEPCKCTRRQALGAASLTALGAGALSGCGPEDEGFGTAAPIRADDAGVPLDDLPEGATTMVNFGGQRPFVAIVRGNGDELTAFSGYCTHQGCALNQDNNELHCPCHGSGFDPETGEVLRGPAAEHLPEVAIVVEDGRVRRA